MQATRHSATEFVQFPVLDFALPSRSNGDSIMQQVCQLLMAGTEGDQQSDRITKRSGEMSEEQKAAAGLMPEGDRHAAARQPEPFFGCSSALSAQASECLPREAVDTETDTLRNIETGAKHASSFLRPSMGSRSTPEPCSSSWAGQPQRRWVGGKAPFASRSASHLDGHGGGDGGP
jgi:hypothetical protein